jgi:2-amino-4-hydroxy-6-hydroxymethyldihydropteridine diphosphokinase
LPVDVYVAAGSNASPVANLRAAVAALARAFGPLRCSSVYRSAAAGPAASDYLNLAIGFSTDLGSEAVKRVLEAIEAQAGRARSGPRSIEVTLDLDLAVHGRRVDAARRLPHEDVLRRAFVLGPIAELAPRLVHPLTGEQIGLAWKRAGHEAAPLLNLGSIETLA